MKNITTKELRKEKAIELMKEMHVYKDFIDCFRKNDYVCYYENGIGYWAFQDEELEKKRHEIEERYHCSVYAITHEYTEFGECYDFIYVPERHDEWSLAFEKENDYNYVFAYVWNKTDEWCSELGTIVVANRFGGLVRVG